MRNQTQQHTSPSTKKPSQSVNVMACASSVEKRASIRCASRGSVIKKAIKSPIKSAKSASTPTGNFNFVGLAG